MVNWGKEREEDERYRSLLGSEVKRLLQRRIGLYLWESGIRVLG